MTGRFLQDLVNSVFWNITPHFIASKQPAWHEPWYIKVTWGLMFYESRGEFVLGSGICW